MEENPISMPQNDWSVLKGYLRGQSIRGQLAFLLAKSQYLLTFKALNVGNAVRISLYGGYGVTPVLAGLQ